jgi:hypothetical protein
MTTPRIVPITGQAIGLTIDLNIDINRTIVIVAITAPPIVRTTLSCRACLWDLVCGSVIR